MDIAALSYGAEIGRLLTSTGGRVIAVLSNAIYLQSCEGYVVAVVGEDAVDGPLSLRIGSLPSLLDAVHNRPNPTFAIERESVHIAGIARIHLDQAHKWSPDLPGSLGDTTGRHAAVRKLIEVVAGHVHDYSLARVIATCQPSKTTANENYNVHFFQLLRDARYSTTHTSEKKSPANLAIEHLLTGMLAFETAARSREKVEAGDALMRMIGLGPGLTPSGDDVVSGILAALVWQARLGAIERAWAEQLVAQVRSASASTNYISARLLWYAGEGVLYEPAVQLGHALLAGDSGRIVEPAVQLLAIGNTSGSDLAIGMLVGCLALSVIA
ncbi:MAG: DUF2877 domain-containing protein [Chloroflexota bacterium]